MHAALRFAALNGKGSRAANCLRTLAMLLCTSSFRPALSQATDASAQQSHEPSHARVELIAESNATGVAGMRVGLHFKLDPGWHIYWQNSGDSGQPPSVAWQLPRGFTAGAIEWPAPQRLDHPPLVDYGYEDDVLLVVPIHAPANRGKREISNGEPIRFAGRVKWLVCREICIPGKAQVTVDWPAPETRAERAAHRRLFAQAAEHIPRPMPASWRASAASSGNHFVLTLHTAQPMASAIFFPLDPEQIENSAPQRFSAAGGNIRITLQKSEHLLHPISTLDGVVVFPSGRAYTIHARIMK